MFYSLLFGRGRGPRPNSQKKTRPRPNSKKINPSPPLPSVFFFCCLGGGRVSFFCCLGGGVFFFAVWAGVVFLFLLFGRCVPFFCFSAAWAGDGSSLTYRSAWLVFKRPNNKKNKQHKKHGFQE